MYELVPKVYQVDRDANKLRAAGEVFDFRHHLAGSFLHAVVNETRAGRELTMVAFARSCRDEQVTPDRSAMRRIIKAVNAVLCASGSETRVVAMPRHATVGPWRLEIAADELWQVTAVREVKQRPTMTMRSSVPCLSPRMRAPETLGVISTVAVADDLARQGDYAEACLHLEERTASLALSDESAALLHLRQARWRRRSGQLSQASGNLDLAEQLCRRAHPEARPDLMADVSLQRARLAYDVDPLDQAGRINFTRLGTKIDGAGSASLRWESANLQAQVARRRLQRQVVAGQRDEREIGQYAAVASHSFASAFFWLVAANDPYHLQAVLVNYAYHLQWLAQHNIGRPPTASIQNAVDAWRVSQTISERFDLPEDSAWDYIMLADLWLGNNEARSLLRSDARLWPRERSPALPDFYVRCVELAQKLGNPRQKILALDRCAAFMREFGDASRAAQAKSDRDRLLAEHSKLAAHLLTDGLWAGGFP